jgi:nuclear pore complex protein Nup93
MWTLHCCQMLRAGLENSQFRAEQGTRSNMIHDLIQTQTDLSTYTSQLRYKFPNYVYDALARAQAE